MSELNVISPWFEAVPDQRRYPLLQKQITADVVVVGAGIVGIMAAWEFAQQGKHVIVLEKNHLAGGNTSLTTAFLTRVPDASLPELAKKYGLEFCQQLLQATTAAQQKLFSLIKTEQIECDFTPCNSYMYAYEANDVRLQNLWKIYQQCDSSAKFISDPKLVHTGAPIAAAIYVPNEAHFHVRKFLLGLLQRSGAENITMYEASAVTDLLIRKNSVLIQTAAGSIKAKKVIMASGVPDALFPELQSLFHHTITHVLTADYSTVAPISNDLFWDVNDPYFYYRRINNRTIMLGGADHPADELLDKGVPEKNLEQFLHQYFAQQNFTVQHSWSGSIFFTEDELPYIDQHPQYSNVIIASGLGGNGMVMGAMAGTMAAATPSALFSFKRSSIVLKKHDIRSLWQRYPEISQITTKILRVLIPFTYLVTLILPGYYFFQARSGLAFFRAPDARIISLLIFPLFGLYAFTFVWVQLMIGTNLPYLRKIFRWSETYHRVQGMFTLVFALTHPLLLLFGVSFETYRTFQFVSPELVPFAIMGTVQLFLLLLTVATAILRKRPWLQTRWHYIHYLNYLIFGLAWIHGWYIGSDTQLPPLRYIWIAFGVTGLVSTMNRLRRVLIKTKVSSNNNKQFVVVAAVGDVTSGQPLCVTAHGKKLAVFMIAGKYYAIDNTCSHAGGPLCQGKLTDNTIQCPWHGAKFDITSGKAVGSPATIHIASYRTRVINGELEVEC